MSGSELCKNYIVFNGEGNLQLFVRQFFWSPVAKRLDLTSLHRGRISLEWSAPPTPLPEPSCSEKCTAILGGPELHSQSFCLS